MKKLALVLFAGLLFLGLSAQDREPAPGTVTVMGEASMKLSAEYVNISLRVEQESENAAEALKELNSRMSRIIAFLKKQKGVQEVQTDYVNLSPRSDYNNRDVRRFRAVQQLSFRLNNLEQYDRLMAELMDLGVNGISGVNFKSDRAEKVKADLMKRAVLDAREKATILADALGQSIGKALYISDHLEQGQDPRPMMMMDYKSSRESGPSVAPGEMEVTMTVKVRFILN